MAAYRLALTNSCINGNNINEKSIIEVANYLSVYFNFSTSYTLYLVPVTSIRVAMTLGNPMASSSPSIIVIELEIDLHKEKIQEVQQTLSSFTAQNTALQASTGKALTNLTLQQLSF